MIRLDPVAGTPLRNVDTTEALLRWMLVSFLFILFLALIIVVIIMFLRGRQGPHEGVPKAPEQRQPAKKEARTKQETDEQIKREADAAAARFAEAQAKPEAHEQPPQLRRPTIFLCYRREDTQWAARSITRACPTSTVRSEYIVT
jgi:hypothetical protein